MLRQSRHVTLSAMCLLALSGCGRNRDILPETNPSPSSEQKLPPRDETAETELPQHQISAAKLFHENEIPHLKYNIRVRGVFPRVKQDKPKACWVAVGAMMAGWKKSKDADTLGYAFALGEPYFTIYDKDHGLNPTQAEAFLNAAGLKYEYGHSYLPSAMANLIDRFGPVWFTIAPRDFSQHATVVIGLIGYEDVDRLHVIYVDPADGKEHSLTYRKFMKEYEAVVVAQSLLIPTDKKDDSRPELFQIIHYP